MVMSDVVVEMGVDSVDTLHYTDSTPQVNHYLWEGGGHRQS